MNLFPPHQHLPTPMPALGRTRLFRVVAPCLLSLTCWGGAASRGDDQAQPARVEAILTLADGEAVAGSIGESERTKTIAWKSPAFDTPFHFPLEEVVSIRFPVAGKPPAAGGMFGFRLAGGAALYGSIVSLDKEFAELESPRFGRIKVERSRLQQVFRWRDGRDLIYDGPNGLAGWREFSAFKTIAGTKAGNQAAAPRVGFGNGVMKPAQPAQLRGQPAQAAAQPAGPATPLPSPWEVDGGQLVTTQGGASVQGDVGLPAQASIELEISWTATPNFMLALGVSEDEKTIARAFRFEVWEGQLVALRETDDEATLTPIQPIPAGPGRVHLRVDLDQVAGKLMVYSEAGDRLADLTLAGSNKDPLSSVRLTNIQGDLRLERLRVSRWDGESTRPTTAGDMLVTLLDKSTVRGQLDRFDPATREFLIEGKDGPTRVAEDKVDAIALSRLDDDLPETVRVVYADGTELGGKWVGLAGQQLTMTVAGISGIIPLPLQGVRSLDFPRQVRKNRERDESLGTLEIDGLKLVGRLADSGKKAGEGTLAWFPLASETPSTIRPGASGRIVFKTQAADNPFRPTGGKPVPVPSSRVRTVTPALPAAGNRRSLYLRSGDIVPVEVTRIDEEGVTFQSPILESHFVPNARIKALELAADDPTALRISKVKLDRLLTLPRMQKESPPTHLIRVKNGDMLRGRVVGMDDKTLRVEVRLDEKEIPRDRVSRMIWLHADETDPSKKIAAPAEVAAAAGQTRVQAVRTDGVRLTFMAEGFADGAVLGKSDVLGSCKVQTKDLEQLLIGGMVEQEATQLAYQDFRLHKAIEPKSASEEDGSPDGGDAGTEAALVGKLAPDFQLRPAGRREVPPCRPERHSHRAPTSGPPGAAPASRRCRRSSG